VGGAAVDEVDGAVIDQGAVGFQDTAVAGADRAVDGDTAGEGEGAAAVDQHRAARTNNDVSVDGAATGEERVGADAQVVGEGVGAAGQLEGGGIGAVADQK